MSRPAYVTVFAGSTTRARVPGYAAFSLTNDTALLWPPQVGTSNCIARVNDVTPGAAGLTLSLPHVTAVAAGTSVLFTNNGAFSFALRSYTGVAVATISPGQTYAVYAKGTTWGAVQAAATVAAASTSTLAGAGLRSTAAPALYAAQPVVVTATPTTLTAANRANVLGWTGASGTFALPLVSAVGSDYMVSTINRGTGTLTLSPSGGQLIDGAVSLALNPGSGIQLHSHAPSSAWYTIGRGRSPLFSHALLSKVLSSGTYTLSAIEGRSTILVFTGVLLGSATVRLLPIPQVYYVYNNTSGAFNVTFATNVPNAATVTLQPGIAAILFCNGASVINCSTTITGVSTLSLAQGSTSNPAISYINGNTNTGIYQPVSNTVAITTAGSEIMRWTTSGFTTPATAVTWSGNPTHSGNHTFSGNVSIGGTLGVTGAVTGNLTGNAGTATTLATGRTIGITGDLAYTSPSFNGSGNVTAASTLATVNTNVGTFGSNSVIPSLTVNGKGLTTAVATNTVGNATTATALQTARQINGTNFDGTADITVTADAGTLTGTTLNATITASSLTSLGSLTALTVSGSSTLSGGLSCTTLSTTAAVSLGASSANTLFFTGTPSASSGLLRSSTYVPTLTGSLNLSFVSFGTFSYVRIGAQVMAWGTVTLTATAAGLVQLVFNAPITNVGTGASSDAAGVATPFNGATLCWDASNLYTTYYAPAAGTSTFNVHFGYTVT